MSTLNKFTELLSKIIKYFTFILLAIMVCIITAQVFFRYVVGSSLSWSEELSRFLFVWIILLGAANGVKEQYHVAITALVNKLPKKIAYFFDMVVIILVLITSICMVIFGYQMALKASTHLSAAMRVSTIWQYLPVPVSGVIMVIFSIERLLNKIFKKTEGEI